MASPQVRAEVSGFSDDDGYGVEATCTRCGHSRRCLGTGAGSVRRALWLLRESCPFGERNFYFTSASAEEGGVSWDVGGGG